MSPVTARGRDSDLYRDIVVVGASAGGLGVLTRLVAGLPGDLPAAVFVVLHIPPDVGSLLPDLLSRAGSLRAAHPGPSEPIRFGHVYVAPPDRHLLVGPGVALLSAGPREHYSRPAVDPLFRSAAAAYGPRVIGVVLSGRLCDGAAGLGEIRRAGGVTVAQSPDGAEYDAMPRSAIAAGIVDYVTPAADLAPLLVRLIGARGGHTEGLSEGIPTACQPFASATTGERGR